MMLRLWEEFIPKYLALSSDKLCEYIKTVSQDINKVRQDASLKCIIFFFCSVSHKDQEKRIRTENRTSKGGDKHHLFE